jgi:hypothetical protein
MQNPTDQAGAEASIPQETIVTGNGPNMSRKGAVRRKAAKRTHPFDLAAGELHLLPSSPEAEDIPPARKKSRLEEPLPTTTDEAARKAASPSVSVRIPPPPAAGDDSPTNANGDLVTDTQPNAGATTVTHRRWTLEEDAKLTSAATNTSKMKWRKEYKTNWDAVAVLVPSRTSTQCMRRWKDFLDPNIDRASGRTGKWTAGEDSKLMDAVQTHDGENWETIAALVPGRTKIQCSNT